MLLQDIAKSISETVGVVGVTLPGAVGFAVILILLIVPILLGGWAIVQRFRTRRMKGAR